MQAELVADELTATGQSAYQLVSVGITRLMGSIEIARLDVQALESRRPFTSAAGRQAELEAAFTAAVQTWQQSASRAPGW